MATYTQGADGEHGVGHVYFSGGGKVGYLQGVGEELSGELVCEFKGFGDTA